jgi:hypothetical protein
VKISKRKSEAVNRRKDRQHNGQEKKDMDKQLYKTLHRKLQKIPHRQNSSKILLNNSRKRDNVDNPNTYIHGRSLSGLCIILLRLGLRRNFLSVLTGTLIKCWSLSHREGYCYTSYYRQMAKPIDLIKMIWYISHTSLTSDTTQFNEFVRKVLAWKGTSLDLSQLQTELKTQPQVQRKNKNSTNYCFILYILLSGDVHYNPGHIKYPCTYCKKPTKCNQKALQYVYIFQIIWELVLLRPSRPPSYLIDKDEKDQGFYGDDVT